MRVKIGSREWEIELDQYGIDKQAMVVDAGSKLDNTGGKVGLHWINPQYAGGNKKVLAFWAADYEAIKIEVKKIQAEETAKKENVRKVEVKTRVHGVDGWCDKCHSYCYGDCEAN